MHWVEESTWLIPFVGVQLKSATCSTVSNDFICRYQNLSNLDDEVAGAFRSPLMFRGYSKSLTVEPFLGNSRGAVDSVASESYLEKHRRLRLRTTVNRIFAACIAKPN